MMLRAVIRAPITAMARELATGRNRVMAVARGDRSISRPPFTKRRPTAVSTPARPRLKANTRASPNPVLWRETAARSSTSAAGHGRSPPEIPSPIRERQVTGEPSAPGGRCEWPWSW